MTGHTMSVKLDEYRVVLTPVCHELKGINRPIICDATEWLTNHAADMTDLCANETKISLYDGMPITVQWNGFGYEWRKADRDT